MSESDCPKLIKEGFMCGLYPLSKCMDVINTEGCTWGRMDRSWNDSVLRVMLDKLSKDEIIGLLITTINAICEKDEDLKEVTHGIVTYIQVQEIILGKSKLEDYKEPHRTELQKELEKLGWKSDKNLMLRITKKE